MQSSLIPRHMSVRQRTRRACQSCRRRKRRCDGQLPCRACAEFDYDCSYADTIERSSRAQTIVDTAPEASGSHESSRDHTSPERSIQPGARALDAEHDEDKFFEPNKLRYYDARSAISFPRALAMSLRSGIAPRIHSFAYNVGVLPEKFLDHPGRRLSDIINFDLAEQLTRRYFDVVNPVFVVLPVETFFQRLHSNWGDASSASPFEALAAFVILLGSFFSVPAQFPAHGDLLQYALDILDQNDFRTAPSLLYIEHFQAWILRTIYVRCTTRPNIAWLSSSMTLHIAESLGLHRERSTVGCLGIDEISIPSKDSHSHRRLFWLAWMLNRMISFEIGRSPTLINDINIKLPSDEQDSICTQAIQTYISLYPDGGHTLTDDIQGCLDTIASKTLAGPSEEPHLALVRADVALGLYREMHKLNTQSLEKSGQRFVAILRPAYIAAQALLEDMQPWWWILSVPFQSICAALSIGKSGIIQMLPEAMQVLHATNQRFGTKMTNEADQTAKALLRDALQAKNADAALLNSVVSSTSIWEGIDQEMGQEDDGSFFFWNNEYG